MREQLKAEALATVGAPAAYDLRNVGGNNFVTPIQDQSACGSCVAFGTVATVERGIRKTRQRVIAGRWRLPVDWNRPAIASR